MNKETKVGLLVGLSFIVLFGVILSNQAPDIVAPAERPMVAPARAHRTDAQIVRQIDNSPPPPEPVDVVAELVEEPAPTTAEQPPKSAVADASADKNAPKSTATPAESTTLSASNPAGATKTITAENLGPETADAEPGDDGMQVVSSKVNADGTKTTVYIVKSGDSLAKIARQHYGDATNRSIDKIYEANKAKMPNKRTLAVGMKLQVPAKPAPKDETTDNLLSSGKFDEVAELKPARSETDAPKIKDATAARDGKDAKDAAAVKDTSAAKDLKDTKEVVKASPKDARKSPARTAVAEVSQEMLDSILSERTTTEQDCPDHNQNREYDSRPGPGRRPRQRRDCRQGYRQEPRQGAGQGPRKGTGQPLPGLSRQLQALPDPEGRHLVQTGSQVHGRCQALARPVRP